MFVTYNVFTADTLRHSATVTFDSLKLNVSMLHRVHVIKRCTKF